MAGKKRPKKSRKSLKSSKKASKVQKGRKTARKKANSLKQTRKTKVQSSSKHPVRDHVNHVAERISGLDIQGANDIAKAAAGVFKHIAENSESTNRKAFIEELAHAAEKLKGARSTEPALRNVVDTIYSSVERYELRSIDNVRKYARKQAEKMLATLRESVETISGIGAEEIRDGDVILTHCHSENVVEILKKAKEKRRKFSVIVTETRPLCQGLMTARELSEAHIDTTYIIDASVASYMKQATKVLIGADAILADGSIVNKIGTYTIALVAEQFQTPVFVATETLKYDQITVMGAAEPIEHRKPDEIADPKGLRGVKISNPAFDVTPADLVSALITEKGVMKPELIREVVKSPV